MGEIAFDKDLQVYIRQQFPKLTVNSAATLQIAKLLNIANNKLLTEMVRAKKPSHLHASQYAAEKVLPKYLLRLAKCEAMRQLALFEIGVIQYNGSTNVKINGKVSSSASSKTKKVMASKPGPGGKKGKKGGSSGGSGGLRKMRRPLVTSPLTVFRMGVTKLHHLSHSYLSMEKDGAQYLSSCLYYFLKQFAGKMALLNLKQQAGPMEMRTALSGFLGPNVFRSAISEGNKWIMLHENDLIKFDPKDIHKQDPKMFSTALDTHSFREGIHFLLHHRFSRPFAAVDNSSEYVEHVLLEVARLFASEVSGNCVRSKAEYMDDTDIKNMMEDILPGELRRHAIARATKALADYVAETSELYHSSIGGTTDSFPPYYKETSSAKSPTKPRSKRMRVEGKPGK